MAWPQPSARTQFACQLPQLSLFVASTKANTYFHANCFLIPISHHLPPLTLPELVEEDEGIERDKLGKFPPSDFYELRTREIRFSCLELMFILGVDRFHERAGKICLDDGNLRAFLRFLQSCN